MIENDFFFQVHTTWNIWNKIGDDGGKLIIEALNSNTTLTELDLSTMAIYKFIYLIINLDHLKNTISLGMKQGRPSEKY